MPNNIENKEPVVIRQDKRIKPDWLKVEIAGGGKYSEMKKLVKEHNLHTICESGKCPNIGECWGVGTATFMIGGNTCTRSCQFCNVATGKGDALDPLEPFKVAQSISIMEVKHAVVTSVDRDDLPDGGAEHWAKTVLEIRKWNPETTLETLIPDFQGKEDQLDKVIEVHPEIVSHNIETVRRLTKMVRIQAKYDRSMDVLKYLRDKGMKTKSGLMLGMGETDDEIRETLEDLRRVGVDIITMGQYLQPTARHLKVDRYVTPEEFEKYKMWGIELGFEYVESGPLIRSSYHAERHLK
ncbi:MAG: lipoyl synthase [Flavobacteriales bacterium]|nr:lipoyl synthase [Bacteroidota bacterium]MCB9240037.1 lipoyl synthase [Flavobacteriales bacterium]